MWSGIELVTCQCECFAPCPLGVLMFMLLVLVLLQVLFLGPPSLIIAALLLDDTLWSQLCCVPFIHLCRGGGASITFTCICPCWRRTPPPIIIFCVYSWLSCCCCCRHFKACPEAAGSFLWKCREWQMNTLATTPTHLIDHLKPHVPRNGRRQTFMENHLGPYQLD